MVGKIAADIILPGLGREYLDRISEKNQPMEKLRAAFEGERYVLVRHFLEEPLPSLLFRYATMHAQVGATLDDVMVPDSQYLYGDPLMESTLELCRPVIESITGLQLIPTYAYCRIYKQGDVLNVHKDRPACEISATMTLGYDLHDIRRKKPEYSWPIIVEGNSFVCEPGEILLYHGCELKHWREAFEGYYQAQLFMHYVDRNGPFTAEKYDTRPALGLPDFTRGAPTLDEAHKRIQKQYKIDSVMRQYRQRRLNAAEDTCCS
jgi:hypothetical protein